MPRHRHSVAARSGTPPQIDPAGGLPVLVLEEPLVELARGVAGEFLAEVDRTWALDVGELAPAELDQLARERGGLFLVGRHDSRVDDGLDLFAEVVVRHTEHGDVDHLVVGDQHVLGLLRIDVHAAGDDHVGLAVGEVQEAVGVEVADVAERAPALRVPRVLRLLGVVVVFEFCAALEVDGAGLSLRQPRRRRHRRCAARS